MSDSAYDWRSLIERPEWMDRAACRGLVERDDIFFPSRGESTRPAKLICGGCPVQAECLAYALNTGEKYGIWGGTSERERRRLRRRLGMREYVEFSA